MKNIVNRKVKRNGLEVSKLIWDFLGDHQETSIWNLVYIEHEKEQPGKRELTFYFNFTFNFMGTLNGLWVLNPTAFRE